MRRILELFNIKGKSSRIKFIGFTVITILFIFIGLCFIFSNLVTGVNFKIINMYIKLYIIISNILILLWIITGVKRCRDLKLPILIFFIPMILIAVSMISKTLMKVEYFFLYKLSFILQLILIIVLSLFKGR